MGKPDSVASAMAMALHQTEIDARNQSYAVATEAIKGSRFESGEAQGVVDRWTKIADGVYAKIKGDMDAIFKK